MRKWNAVIGMAMMVIFLVHAIGGSLSMAGIISGGNPVILGLTRVLVLLMAAHIVIGVILTARTIRACRRSGASYFRENKRFWIRRASGFAIVLFMIHHMVIFSGDHSGGAYRLSLFAGAQLISSLLLVASIAVHLITNIEPLSIALGIKDGKEFAVDLLLILSILLFVMGAAFIIYYLRWRVI